ncbi:MAG: methylmalonyl Co-A mutase-associated GTPase MeaB, partial [Pseudomonadota bacterium]
GAWSPRVMRCSALQHEGLEEIWTMIEEFVALLSSDGRLAKLRAQQSREWMHQLVHSMLQQRLHGNSAVRKQTPVLESQVEEQILTPYAAARELITLLDAG